MSSRVAVVLALAGLWLTAPGARAADAPTPATGTALPPAPITVIPNPDEPRLAPGAHSRRETWYTYWGLGFMHPVYERGVQGGLDQVQAAGASRATYDFELLGFYWPLSVRSNDVLGFVVDYLVDSYTLGSDVFTVNQQLVAASYMKFFGPEVGEGTFVRFDAGPARWVLSETGFDSITSTTGYGGAVSAGYGWALSDETRLLLRFGIGYRRIQGRSYESGALTVGGFF